MNTVCSKCTTENVGQESVAFIATHNGLDGWEIESRWGARFSTHVQTYPASYAMGTGSLSQRVNGRSVALATHPPSSAEIKELCPLSGPSWPVLGRIFSNLRE